MSVDVLLAVYNGTPYLAEQLHSLKQQKEVAFRLLARDDCSSDGSKEILQKYHCELLPSVSRLGIVQNFSTLLQASNSDYTFFCDQDDIWLPEKVQLSLLAFNSDKPTLIHTDLKLVDENLKLLSPSFWSHQQLTPTSSLNHLLVQNRVTGCTMGINRKLRQLVGEIPKEAIMHDWWIALVAAAFGQIISLPSATVLYRQHTSNSIGAKTPLQRISAKFQNPSLHQISLKNRHKQAEAFYQRYRPQLSSDQCQALEALLKAPHSSWLKNKRTQYRYGFHRSGFLCKLASSFLSNPF